MVQGFPRSGLTHCEIRHGTESIMRRYARWLAKSLLHRLGYEVRRARPVTDIDYAAALSVSDSEHYIEWSSPCPLFSPCVGDPDFREIYRSGGPSSMVSQERCYTLVSLARYAAHLDGDVAECGVYKGGTALMLGRVLGNAGKRLYLFDSFTGLPKGDPVKDRQFREGQFAVDSIESVKGLLSDYQSIIEIRKGWIPETFAGLETNRYAMAHIDVDLYKSALDCCDYFYPRLVPGGILLFDDYGFAAARGEKDAVDMFFTDKRESPIVLLTGQAFVVKLPPSGTGGR